MTRRLLPLALCLSLFGCASTPSVTAPSQIPPPPAEVTVFCPPPDPIPDMAAKNELADALAEWMIFGGCELSKHRLALGAWPH